MSPEEADAPAAVAEGTCREGSLLEPELPPEAPACGGGGGGPEAVADSNVLDIPCNIDQDDHDVFPAADAAAAC